MKAIIIAAGTRTRLYPFTADLPKCMLQFSGKTLLQCQLEVYKACNIKDIVLVKRYKKEEIKYAVIKYYANDNYQNNNILNSSFYADKEIKGEFAISYSDILFEKEFVSCVHENLLSIFYLHWLPTNDM